MPVPATEAPDRLVRARRSVVCAFMIHAFVSGSYAPRLPDIKETTGVDDAQLGVALGAFALGLLFGARLADVPIARFGTTGVIRAGALLLAFAPVGLAVSVDVLSLACAFGALGLASGLVDVANNTNAVEVERGYRRSIMPALHGMWSAGTLAGGAVGAAAAALGVDPVLHLLAVACFLTAVAAVGLRHLVPAGLNEPVDGGAEPVPLSLTSPVVILSAAGFSATLGEGAAADWSAVYLEDHRGAESGLAAAGYVAFSLGMTAARFTADRVAAASSWTRVITVAAVVAVLGIAGAILAPSPELSVLGWLVFGFGIGPLAPLVFSAAGNARIGRRGALSWVVTISYLGAILGPIAIGLATRVVSLRAALVLPAVFGALVLMLSRRIGRALPSFGTRAT